VSRKPTAPKQSRRKPRLPAHRAPPCRPAGVNLFALPSGGFLVRDPLYIGDDYKDGRGNVFRCTDAAAFSTLDELLEWLGLFFSRPVEEPQS